MLVQLELLLAVIYCCQLGNTKADSSNAITDKKKRILLSDPDYVQQQLTHLQSEIQRVEASSQLKIQQLETKLNATSAELGRLASEVPSSTKGTIFTRWGRTSCPGNVSTLVYTGYAGGSYFTHSGGAAEYVCMPTDPIWGPHKNDIYSDGPAYMYGAEYQEPLSMFVPNNNDKIDVPCSVCLSDNYTTILMIPGRTECYPGWTEAYHGDLASGAYGHASASEYVCVDGHPEALPGGGTTNDNGKLFYGVKSKCGSLRCPPYEDEKFLSCVVCLK